MGLGGRGRRPPRHQRVAGVRRHRSAPRARASRARRRIPSSLRARARGAGASRRSRRAARLCRTAEQARRNREEVIVLTLLLALSLLPFSPQATHADAKALAFSEPAMTANLAGIKGQPTHIAWSPDGSQVFVQTGDRTRIGTYENPHFYVVTPDGKVASVGASPAWVAEYSAWKANKWAPGNRSFAIDIDDQRRTQRATSAPVGGDLAKGGGGSGQGSSADDAVNAALDSQVQHVR